MCTSVKRNSRVSSIYRRHGCRSATRLHEDDVIILVGAIFFRFEQRLKDRMALVVHNIENILHCFKDVDVKKTKSVSERAAGLQRFCPQPTPVLF
jgi:hypothetical protein